MRSAVVGPTTISPPCADPAKRAATFVVGPVAVVALDDLQEAREVGLDELVEALGVELLGQLRVARDVEEEHGHLDALLLELRGVGVLLEELLDGVGHELRELALELFE